MKRQSGPIIISLGGSLVCPDGIDEDFLKRFTSAIEKISTTRKVVIVVGGGMVCRRYQNAAKALGATDRELDWIGIMATRLNAQLVASALGKAYTEQVVTDPTRKTALAGRVIIAAGWKPGFSTDQDSVLLAKKTGAKEIINLTNQDYVHTGDPKTDPTARPIKRASWKEYLGFIKAEWKPGLSTPFDPVASRTAQKERLTVHIINGKRLERLEAAIAGRTFIGTTITPERP